MDQFMVFFKKNKIENFEKKISDKFFYWNRIFQ